MIIDLREKLLNFYNMQYKKLYKINLHCSDILYHFYLANIVLDIFDY